jgi:hypothetical protein
VVARLVARGLLGSALVLAGGIVTATLPPSTALLHVDGFGDALVTVRESTAGRMAGLALVLVGLGLLAASWLRLCRRVAGSEDPAACTEVWTCTAAWTLPLLLAPPLFSRDGWSYAAQGMLARIDLSPYEHGPSWLAGPIVEAVDPLWKQTPAPYGPVPLVFGEQAIGLTTDPWLLVMAHRGLALAGLVLLAWAVPRLASWTGVNPALASALVLASPLMLANGVAGLHNDLLMVGLMAAALVVAAERGWAWGAVLAGTAAGVKIPGGLVCVGIVLLSLPVGATLSARVRRSGAVGLVAGGTLLGLGVVTGLGSGWIAGLTVPGAVDTPLSVTTLVGNALDGLTGLSVFHDLLRAVGTLVALVVGAWVTSTRPTGRPEVALTAVGVTTLALVVLAPVVHLWYLLWTLPFLATLRLTRVGTTTLVAALVVGGLVAPLDSSLHGAYVIIVFASMLAALLGVLLLLTRGGRDRLDRIAGPGQAVASTRLAERS